MSKWDDGFELSALFVMDEKHFFDWEGGGGVVAWIKAPGLIKTAKLAGIAIFFFRGSEPV